MSLVTWRDYVYRSNGDNFRVNPSPRYATFSHPGLNYSGFDRLGSPDILSLLELLTDVFAIGVHGVDRRQKPGLSLMDYPRLLRNFLHFHVVTEYTVSRAMYDPNIAKWPLDTKVSFGSLGRTSLSMMVELFSPGSQEPVIKRVGKSVLVNQSSRTPTPCPDWLRDELEGKEVAMDEVRMNKFSRPSWAYVHRIKIVKSDTDGYDHTTYSSYVRFGLDALYLALLEKSGRHKSVNNKVKSKDGIKGHDDTRTHVTGKNGGKDGDEYTEVSDALPGQIGTRDKSSNDASMAESESEGTSFAEAVNWLTEDIMKNGLKKLKISYLSECGEGDDINVFVWQENGEELAARCCVESKVTSRVHCQLIFEYFAPLPNL